MSQPALAVVVVTHDTREHLLGFLSSLAEDPARAEWEVVVVDNESRDGTAEAVRSRHPWARVVRNEVGRGFAGGVNQGVAATSAPAVVTFTPDTRVPAGTLGRLLEVLWSDERIGAVGPLVLFPDGTVQRHGMYRPRPYTALVVLLGLARLPLFAREAERYYGRHEPGPPRDVDLLTGACLMFTRAAYERVGPFDERFFVYIEDVDWCVRARAAGLRLVFVPEVEVTHEKAATSRTSSAEMIRLFYRSARAFYAKHHAPRDPAPLRALWYAGLALKERVALLSNAVSRRKGLRY